ncbi:DMT family transporter [uncultured Cohaesibacter sp.]|uniref:DMT family transporter n=1 Tax=uncultured Cohaesibacter sp. TaxID=1002546 RepID=UPI00292EF2C1|nr:DMT family transporter [uncultured Cohaesibacter sp.]
MQLKLDGAVSPSSTPAKVSAFGEDKGSLYGIMMMQLSALLFATNDMVVKLIGVALPAGQIGFMRGCFAIVLLFGMLLFSGQIRMIRQASGKRVLMRGGLEAIAALLYLISLQQLPLANYTSFVMVIPLVATAAAALFLSERVGIRRWSAIILGLLGVLVIVRPGLDGYNSFSLFALAATFIAAARDLVTRRLPQGSALWVVALSTMILMTSAAFLYGLTEDWGVPSLYHLVLLAFSALFMTLGQAAVMIAIGQGDFSAVAPFRFMGLVFALIYGFVFWGDMPDGLTWLGILLVLSSGLYAMYRERQLARNIRT